MKTTISGLPRLELCRAAGVLPHFPGPPSHYARRGTALHRFLELVAQGVSREAAALEVAEEYRREALALDLEALPHSQGTWRAEVAFAYDYETGAARELEVREREYPELGETEVAGTADLVGLDGDTVLVLDVKTGHAYLGRPKDSLQLLGYALAAAATYKATKARVMYLFVREDEEPFLVQDELDELALAAAADRVREVCRPELGEPTPVPGDHCRYCPAFRGCPAHTRMLAMLTTDVKHARGALGSSTLEAVPVIQPAHLPIIFERIKLVRDMLERLEAEAKDAVRACGEVPMPDGKVLAEVEVVTETFDPDIGAGVLAEVFGPEAAAAAVKVKKSLTKKAIDELVRARCAQTREKMTHVWSELHAQMNERGGIVLSRYWDVKARKAP